MCSKMVYAVVLLAALCVFVEQTVALRLSNAYMLPSDNVFVPGFSEVKRFRSEPIRFGKRAPFREPVRFGKRSPSWPSSTVYEQDLGSSIYGTQ